MIFILNTKKFSSLKFYNLVNKFNIVMDISKKKSALIITAYRTAGN